MPRKPTPPTPAALEAWYAAQLAALNVSLRKPPAAHLWALYKYIDEAGAPLADLQIKVAHDEFWLARSCRTDGEAVGRKLGLTSAPGAASRRSRRLVFFVVPKESVTAAASGRR